MKSRIGRLILWLAAAVLFALALSAFYKDVILMGNPPSLHSKRLLLFLGVGLPAALACVLFTLAAAWRGVWPGWISRLQQVLLRLPLPVRALLAAFLLVLPAWLFNFSAFALQPSGFWLRLGALLLSALLSALLSWKLKDTPAWLVRFALLTVIAAAGYALADTFTRVSSYPFSLGWSEGNRLWDYSVLFGSARYLHPANEPIFAFISPGRQFVWALPFLLPGITIQGVRLWDALMWVLPGLALGWLASPKSASLSLARRIGFRLWWQAFPKSTSRRLAWQISFTLWCFLFLSQGPIYAPIILAAILVVLALRLRPLGWSLLLVAAAGYFASISRWTWTYAPGLWAGLLALLEIPAPTLRRAGWRSLLRPVSLGLAGYLGGQFLPTLVDLLRGAASQPVSVLINPANALTRQPLLWYRLLPNPTFPPGILLGTLWALLPLVVLLVYLALRRHWKVNLLQGAAVLVISAVFLAVGLVASTKIGGGSNLHNLDMLWITLALTAAWALRDALTRLPASTWLQGGLALCLVLALLFPAAYMLQYGGALELPTGSETADALSGLRAAVPEFAAKGEVLFLDQRQLLAFGDVPQVPLVVEYEKKYLMEQAMRANRTYFDDFYRDLANQRFVLILTEPLQSHLQTETAQFGEENDAWVRYVSVPVMCYYQEYNAFSAVGVQLLVPRTEPDPACPLPAEGG